jgi:hypothetical protein
MTEFDISSAIMNYVTSSEGVTSSNISIRQIRDEVDTLRIRLVSELDVQNRFIFPFDEYLQIIEVNTTRENNLKVATIPTIFFRANGKPVIRYAGGTSGNTPHKVVVGNRRTWASHDPYTGKAATIYYNNGKLTFLSKNVPKKVMVEAVFRKPSELKPFGYNYKEDHYPAPFSLTDTLIGKTSESYIRTMYRILPQPNTQSDIPTGQAMQ